MNYLTPTQRTALLAALDAGLSNNAAAAQAGIATNTVHRWKKLRALGVCGGCKRAWHYPTACPTDSARSTPALKAAILAARLNEDLPTEAIAARYNVTLAVAYRALNGHPRRTRARRVNEWSAEEITALRAGWPRDKWPVLRSALPGRTPAAIERQASQLNLTRPSQLRRTVTRTTEPHPIIQTLAAARQSQHLTSADLHARSGVDRHSIIGYELGNAEPTLGRLTRWATALGYELTLIPTQPRSEEATATPTQRADALRRFRGDLNRLVPEPPPLSRPTALERPSQPHQAPEAAPPVKPPAAPRHTPWRPPPASQPRPRAFVPAPPRPEAANTSTRAAELAAQEAFLASRGATRLPPPGDPALENLPPLVYDVKTRRYTRRPDVAQFRPPKQRGHGAPS